MNRLRRLPRWFSYGLASALVIATILLLTKPLHLAPFHLGAIAPGFILVQLLYFAGVRFGWFGLDELITYSLVNVLLWFLFGAVLGRTTLKLHWIILIWIISYAISYLLFILASPLLMLLISRQYQKLSRILCCHNFSSIVPIRWAGFP